MKGGAYALAWLEERIVDNMVDLAVISMHAAVRRSHRVHVQTRH